jgi:hypothetical protein
MTATELANKALVEKLGLPRIDDIDVDTNIRATTIKAAYPDSRQFYLRESAPGFARREGYLAISTDQTSEVYDYVYGEPSGCLKIREVYNIGDPTTKIEYEYGAHSTPDSRVILTNQENAYVIYTIDITNLNMFSDDDIEALACLLAWKCAMPLTRKRELAAEMQQNFLALLAVAKKNNKRSQHKELPEFTDYIDART